MRAGAEAGEAVARIVELAGLQRQATATDTAVQPPAHPGQFVDLLVEPVLQPGADTRPVGLGRRAPVGQGGQGIADLADRQAQLLGDQDEGDAPHIGAFETALPASIPAWLDQALVLVKTDRRDRNAGAFSQLSDGQGIGGGWRCEFFRFQSLTSTKVEQLSHSLSTRPSRSQYRRFP